VSAGLLRSPPGNNPAVATYTVNKRAVEKAKQLIADRQYVLDSDWGDVQPNAAAETPTSNPTRGTSTGSGI
jgi:hypothetical protein